MYVLKKDNVLISNKSDKLVMLNILCKYLNLCKCLYS